MALARIAILIASILATANADGACQVCIQSPADLNLTAGSSLTWTKNIKQQTPLCDINGLLLKNTDATNSITVSATLTALVANPGYCYFTFWFGATASEVACLISGYNIPGGHYTSGSCTALGVLKASEVLDIKVAAAQGTIYPCTLRTLGFVCLEATQV